MATCAMFAKYTGSLTKNLASASDKDAAPTSREGQEQLDKLFSNLSQYEQHFSRHLKILLDALNYLAATETVGFLTLSAALAGVLGSVEAGVVGGADS